MPVETYVACLVLDAVCLDERGQRFGHAREHGLVTVLFLLLYLFPKLAHLASRLCLCLAIDMGVAEDEFVAQLVAHIGNVELSLLTSYLGIEHHVEEHIAQFLAYLMCVVLDEGITQFKGLFYSIGAQTFKRLLAVPRALLAQGVHHIQQPAECRHFFFSC